MMSHRFADTEPALAARRCHLTAADVEDALPEEYRANVIDLTSLTGQTLGAHCFAPIDWKLLGPVLK